MISEFGPLFVNLARFCSKNWTSDQGLYGVLILAAASSTHSNILNLLPFRLIPILVNGMKYSEIDIILLKVSTHLVLICLYLVRGLSVGMTTSSILRLLYDVSCIHTV